MKKIGVLGSTGSIGTQTLEVVRDYPDKLKVICLAAGSNTALLADQVNEFEPELVCIMKADLIADLKTRLKPDLKVEIVAGMEGLKAIARYGEMDTLVTSVSGAIGLEPTLEAIRAGKTIALANKETLVAAGELVMSAAQEYGVAILPVDSEHSALFQALEGNSIDEVERLILTASGGPFRTFSKDELVSVTPERALKHPNWAMGAKITIDSATLMNKGLEVIEAHWLYGIDYNFIDVVVHPQSIIHSLVEYRDKSVIAQLGWPDMKLPIQYALTYPERWQAGRPALDLVKCGNLTFEAPDLDRFPCLALAYACGREGGNAPVVMNAANEVAVGLFLQKRIGFTEISTLVQKTVEARRPLTRLDLETLLEQDAWAREFVNTLVRG